MCTSERERERFFAGTNSRPFRDKLSRVHRYFVLFAGAVSFRGVPTTF